MQKIQKKLLDHYGKAATEFISSGDIIFSAPSSTRQATIFPDFITYADPSKATKKLPSSMSYLLIRTIRENKDSRATFLPITIIPPQKHNNKLNIFRRFTLRIGSPIPIQEAYSHMRRKDFEHFFLLALTQQAPKHLWYPTEKH